MSSAESFIKSLREANEEAVGQNRGVLPVFNCFRFAVFHSKEYFCIGFFIANGIQRSLRCGFNNAYPLSLHRNYER